MEEIRNYSKLEKADQSFDAWKLIADQRTEFVRVHLKPGEYIDTHVNPLVVFFYVLEGKGELTLGTESVTLAKDDLVRVEEGIERKWENTGTAILQFLVIKQL